MTPKFNNLILEQGTGPQGYTPNPVQIAFKKRMMDAGGREYSKEQIQAQAEYLKANKLGAQPGEIGHETWQPPLRGRDSVFGYWIPSRTEGKYRQVWMYQDPTKPGHFIAIPDTKLFDPGSYNPDLGLPPAPNFDPKSFGNISMAPPAPTPQAQWPWDNTVVPPEPDVVDMARRRGIEPHDNRGVDKTRDMRGETVPSDDPDAIALRQSVARDKQDQETQRIMGQEKT